MIFADFLSFVLFENYNYLWLIAFSIWFILGIILIVRALKTGVVKGTRRLYLGYATFIIVFALSKLIWMYPNYLDNAALEQYQFYYRIALILSTASIIFLLSGIDIYLLRTKGFITLFPIVVLVSLFFLPQTILPTLNLITQPAYMVIILISYIIVAKKMPGSVRRSAVRAIIGILLVFIGVLLDMGMFKRIFGIISYIGAPILVLIGMIIFYTSTTAN